MGGLDDGGQQGGEAQQCSGGASQLWRVAWGLDSGEAGDLRQGARADGKSARQGRGFEWETAGLEINKRLLVKVARRQGGWEKPL